MKKSKRSKFVCFLRLYWYARREGSTHYDSVSFAYGRCNYRPSKRLYNYLRRLSKRYG